MASQRGSDELLGLVWRYLYLHSKGGFFKVHDGESSTSILSFLLLFLFGVVLVEDLACWLSILDGFPFDVLICGWVPI